MRVAARQIVQRGLRMGVTAQPLVLEHRLPSPVRLLNDSECAGAGSVGKATFHGAFLWV